MSEVKLLSIVAKEGIAWPGSMKLDETEAFQAMLSGEVARTIVRP